METFNYFFVVMRGFWLLVLLILAHIIWFYSWFKAGSDIWYDKWHGVWYSSWHNAWYELAIRQAYVCSNPQYMELDDVVKWSINTDIDCSKPSEIISSFAKEIFVEQEVNSWTLQAN